MAKFSVSQSESALATQSKHRLRLGTLGSQETWQHRLTARSARGWKGEQNYKSQLMGKKHATTSSNITVESTENEKAACSVLYLNITCDRTLL